MPLTKVEKVGDHTRLALWEMTEKVEELPVPCHVDLTAFRSESRLKEKLITYAILKELTGLNHLVITHEPSGKPVIDGFEIGISHTHGWVAVILSTKRPVAVDIEYRSQRVTRIADRFIRFDEDKSNAEIQLINWCVKETVYKFLPEENLHFFDMRLQKFVLSNAGEITVDDLKFPKNIKVKYEMMPDYVLTWVL